MLEIVINNIKIDQVKVIIIIECEKPPQVQ